MKKAKKKTILRTILILLLSIGVGLGFIPLFQNLNFGLDLQGGFEVLYGVSSIDNSKMTKEKLTSTYKTMIKRIDVLGVSEPEVILEGNDKIRVKLAGIKNQEEARRVLSTTASLSFRDVNDNLLMTSDVLRGGGAKLTVDNSGYPAVLLGVKDKEKFYEVTNKVKDYQDNKMVIWLDFDELTNSYSREKASCGASSDSKCLSAATVSQGFASDVIIQGNFTEDEAKDLVELINSGSLPTKLTEISSKTVGASFGEATLENTLIAGIIGIVAIMVLMIILYRFTGLLSSVSILIYSFLVFLVFWVVGGVLTLPGIAAMVLGIGMAVDANVITFARIKEELQKGKKLKDAYQAGTKQSFSTILDSNLTTLLVAIILFVLGESSVKGFATMLIITIAVTMFTMVFLTRLLMKSFVKNGYFEDKLKTFIGLKPKKETKLSQFDFVKPMKKCLIISGVIILVGIGCIGWKGLKLGIDYQGGSDITIKTTQNLDQNALKDDIKELKLQLTETEVLSDGAYIKIQDVLENEQVKTVSSYFEEKYEAKVDIGVVSNIVKEDLTKNALLSVAFALIGIIIYISIRFRLSYAIGSVVALLHDILITISIFAIFRLEVSVMFIAALLAIIGYSINATIVSFDRIRENLKQDKKDPKKRTYEDLKEIVNHSIRQTVMRSIYTTITTMLPVLALIFLGSYEILNFNLAMLIGLIAGTYSSIFIASGIYLMIEKRRVGKEEKPKKKWYVDDEVEEKKIKGVNS